jgi:hypothetical protein
MRLKFVHGEIKQSDAISLGMDVCVWTRITHIGGAAHDIVLPINAPQVWELRLARLLREPWHKRTLKD